MVNQLIDIVSKEAALFESFLELLEQQKAMLVANDLSGLTRVTASQQEALRESRQLSRQRENVVSRLKAINAIDGDLTVTRLLELIDDEQAGRLLRLKKLILSLHDKINETRNSNAMLLNQSRDFIARTMSALAKINNPDSTYTPAAGRREACSTVVVDRRA